MASRLLAADWPTLRAAISRHFLRVTSLDDSSKHARRNLRRINADNAPCIQFQQYPKIKYTMDNTQTDMAEAMSQAAGNSAADLIRQHWQSIEAAMPDSGKITVSLSLKLRRCGGGYKQTARISYGSKTTDELEDTIDPRQAKMEGIE